MLKPLTVWITINCRKFFKRWEYQTTWSASWEICMQVRKQQLELIRKQQTCSKLEKEFVQAVYCHPVYLTYMQNTSWEMLDGKKHKLESRLPGEIGITSDMQMTTGLWYKVKRNYTASWWKWRGEWKSWLQAQYSENEDHDIWSHHFMGNRGRNSRNSVRLFFWAAKSLQMTTAAMKLRRLFFGRKVMTNLVSTFKRK